jgi:hypothetical protein
MTREAPNNQDEEKVSNRSIEVGKSLVTLGCTICSNGKAFGYLQLGPSFPPFALRKGEGEPTSGLFMSGNLNNGHSDEMSYNFNKDLFPSRSFQFSPYELATPNAGMGIGLRFPFQWGTPNLSGNTSADRGETWSTPPRKIGVEYVNFWNLWSW